PVPQPRQPFVLTHRASGGHTHQTPRSPLCVGTSPGRRPVSVVSLTTPYAHLQCLWWSTRRFVPLSSSWPQAPPRAGSPSGVHKGAARARKATSAVRAEPTAAIYVHTGMTASLDSTGPVPDLADPATYADGVPHERFAELRRQGVVWQDE